MTAGEWQFIAQRETETELQGSDVARLPCAEDQHLNLNLRSCHLPTPSTVVQYCASCQENQVCSHFVQHLSSGPWFSICCTHIQLPRYRGTIMQERPIFGRPHFGTFQANFLCLPYTPSLVYRSTVKRNSWLTMSRRNARFRDSLQYVTATAGEVPWNLLLPLYRPLLYGMLLTCAPVTTLSLILSRKTVFLNKQELRWRVSDGSIQRMSEHFHH